MEEKLSAWALALLEVEDATEDGDDILKVSGGCHRKADLKTRVEEALKQRQRKCREVSKMQQRVDD